MGKSFEMVIEYHVMAFGNKRTTPPHLKERGTSNVKRLKRFLVWEITEQEKEMKICLRNNPIQSQKL